MVASGAEPCFDMLADVIRSRHDFVEKIRYGQEEIGAFTNYGIGVTAVLTGLAGPH